MGTIVPRLSDKFISAAEASKYLYCDGSTFDISKYPKLYTILGINQLPDLRNHFLEGADIGGQIIEAGLPNIKGQFGSVFHFTVSYGTNPLFTGPFYLIGNPSRGHLAAGGFDPGNQDCIFDASRCSAIYGKSNTVQPPAVTVRYYIRAK